MSVKISKLADVHPDAKLGKDVEIGAFCVVGPDAVIGDRSQLFNNVTILGHVEMGEDNRIFPGAVIGGDPQDISYRGSPTKVLMGDRNTIREGVTINRATEKEDGYTRLGSDCYLMGNVHVAHDCTVGDHVIIGQTTMLGGHVHIGDRATLSGGIGIVHYASIGKFCFVGALSRVLQDVAPFMLADGNPSRPRCINIVALKRNNKPKEVISALNEAYRLLYRARVGLKNAKEILESKDSLVPEVRHLLDVISTSQEGRHGRGRELRRTAA